MNLKVLLYGSEVAEFDIDSDPLGWIKLWPVKVHTGWDRVSAASWSPSRQSGSIRPWFDGLLPEGLSREPFVQLAERRVQDTPYQGYGPQLGTQLWANCDWDYPGAVEFVGRPHRETNTGYDPIDEAGIGKLLVDSRTDREMRGRAFVAQSRIWRPSALTGMRGKLVVEPTGQGWALPVGDAKGRWIVKDEDRPHLPGEAGIEAIMQRTMHHLGIRAARTLSRVMGDVQCVLSERADRYLNDGAVKARHQEDFLQASGWTLTTKYWVPGTTQPGPGYPELFRILRDHAKKPAFEQDQLLMLVAAGTLTGNGDMHRRNLGLSHALADEPFHVTLAPVYDVGAFPGVEPTYRGRRYEPAQLALPVGNTSRFEEVSEDDWRTLASDAKLDPEWVLTTVHRVAHALPDALSQALSDARAQDENREQRQVDRRANAVHEFIACQVERVNRETNQRAKL